MILVKTWKFHLCLFLDKIGYEMMFVDHRGEKQALLDYSNLEFTKWPHWDFYKGINPWFWSKIGNFLYVCFREKIRYEIIFDDYLVKEQIIKPT